MRVSASTSVFSAQGGSRRVRRAAFTLLETMIGMSIFVVAGLGVIEMLGLINQNATASRAMSAARLLVGAKIAKAQTDVWTPSNGTVPVGCVAPANNIAVADPKDAFDFAGANADGTPSVVIINSTDPTAALLGTMYHYVSTYESASGSLLITYTLNYTLRGKTYSVSQSTVRVPDQI